jgi:hypothetical protein
MLKECFPQSQNQGSSAIDKMKKTMSSRFGAQFVFWG